MSDGPWMGNLEELASSEQSLTYRQREKLARKEASIALVRAKHTKEPSNYTEVSELPRWAKTALVFKTIYGETYAEAAEHVNRSPNSLSKYALSPAGRKWVSELEKIAENPVALAELIFKGHATNVTLDYMALMEAAVEAGDYKEARMMMQDWLNRAGIISEKKAQSLQDLRPTIVINLSGTAAGAAQVHAEIPEGESSFERVIKEAEVEDADE